MKSPKIKSDYEAIAAEYYDPVRHPTCANFDELSKAFLISRIQKYAQSAKTILEVGAGRSTAAPTIVAKHLSLDRITLLDKSPKMLEHSRAWKERGAHTVVADARNTGLPACHFQLIVAALGDPYNGPQFWNEIERLLEPGGICLFTTPAHEWAERFRKGSDLETAEFLLANGTTVLVRSDIPPVERQIEVVEASRLAIIEVKTLRVNELSQRPSPKLLISQSADETPIVRGFTIVKPSSSNVS